MKQEEAATILKAVREARVKLAQRAKWPFMRHAGFGFVMGVLVSAYALPDAWPLLIVGLCVVATVLIASRDRQRDGFFISGYRKGPTRWLAVVLAVLSLAALAGGAVLRIRFNMVWAPVLLGFLTFILCTAGSLVWQKIYARQLEGRDD